MCVLWLILALSVVGYCTENRNKEEREREAQREIQNWQAFKFQERLESRLLALEERGKKWDSLEKRLTTVETSMIELEKRFEAQRTNTQCVLPVELPKKDDPIVNTETSFPDFYKIKEKVVAWKYLNPVSFLYGSYEIYAGDTYLGEFRQSMPWVRVFWDEMCLYNSKGELQGQVYYSFFRWLGGILPNPFIGIKTLYLIDKYNEIVLKGEPESWFWSLLHGEKPAINFWDKKTDKWYKCKKLRETVGTREWIIQERTGSKIGEVKESVLKDLFGNKMCGWVVSFEENKNDKQLGREIPGYLAAFDLAEHEYDLSAWLLTTTFFGLVCLVIHWLVF
eukprot:TRINITY_DN1300_c0_g1_i3.p1 TRINITY_DN1300_c0_g1~~TRINITY_DN1300_c0_g1_i3.p1  ORF type:complete len:336 (-),score=84.72 TRINITY_DN1300_c0_g1_i3:234-1241(-)